MVNNSPEVELSEINRADELFKNHAELAIKIALGHIKAPDGIKAFIVYDIVCDWAENIEDEALCEKLASSRFNDKLSKLAVQHGLRTGTETIEIMRDLSEREKHTKPINSIKRSWHQRHGLLIWGLAAFLLIGLVTYQHIHQVNASKATCQNPQIKGNINYITGEKIYHVPGDPYYNRTVIDKNAGERMFCTVQDAQKAGWRPSGQ